MVKLDIERTAELAQDLKDITCGYYIYIYDYFIATHYYHQWPTQRIALRRQSRIESSGLSLKYIWLAQSQRWILSLATGISREPILQDKSIWLMQMLMQLVQV